VRKQGTCGVFCIVIVIAFTMSLGQARSAGISDYVINVKDLGAKGDGKTDDTPAIQKAIAKAAKTGATVFIPAGTYIVGPTPESKCKFIGGEAAFALNVPDNVTVTGAGRRRTILKFKNDAGKYVAINVTGKNVRIGKLGIISDKKAPDISTWWGIVLNSARGAIVEDYYADKLSVGVLFSSALECTLRDSHIVNCTGAGSMMYGSTRCVTRDSVIDGCGDGNCAIYGGNRNCHIINCTLLNANQNGVIESSWDCSIRDCTVDGGETGYMGLIVNRSVRATIKGNTVRNLHHGIYVRETDIAGAGGIPNIATRIVDNTITGIRNRNPVNPQTPLYVSYGFATLIRGNIFHNNECPAEIVISGTKLNNSQANCLVTGNIFVLVHAQFGTEGEAPFFARSHPCVYSNAGVTVAGNSITSYGRERMMGRSKYLIDVGPYSIVEGNRNTGLPGLNVRGVDSFIKVKRDSLVTGNFSSWQALTLPVINADGEKCVILNNRLVGPESSAVPSIKER